MNIRPNRVDLHTVRSGETWASLAERTGGLIKPATLAIMNGYEPNQPPRAKLSSARSMLKVSPEPRSMKRWMRWVTCGTVK